MKKRIFVVLALSVAIFVSAQSINELTAAANNGDREAAYQLGCKYWDGVDVPWDKDLAINWLEKSARAGHEKAIERLVDYYFESDAKDSMQKFSYWAYKGAEAGNPYCLYQVAMLSSMNSPSEAERYCLEVVYNKNKDERVYAEACALLYSIYSMSNSEKAFYWLKKAADEAIQSNEDARDCCVRLGLRYFYGKQIQRDARPDYFAAFHYFSKAARFGHPLGVYWVGACYQNGWGTVANCDSAIVYYSTAVSQNCPHACWALGRMNLGDGNCSLVDEKQALFWFNRASYLDTKSLVVLGKYYMQRDYSKAYTYFEKALEQYNSHKKNWDNLNPYNPVGIDDGLKYVAWCLMYGRGTTQNLPQAYSYISQYIVDHPDDAEAYLYLGNYYMIRNQKDSATFMMNKVLASIPKNELQDEEIYRYVFNITDNAKNKKTSVSKISDVDKNIPINVQNNDKTFVVVIANEDYEEVASVPFALNDGKIFALYCQNTLGIPSSNIHVIENATLNKLKREIDWLSQVLEAYKGDAKAIFYYAGHGIPDEKNHDAFLLPVDGYGNDINTGYQISKLYQQLGAIPAKQVVVLMDACFSGAKREGGMLVSARGVAIKVNNGQPTGNMVVLTAAQGDETAYPNNEEGHGMFTYFLLKKLQESKGNVNLMEIGDFVKTNVSQKSIILNGKSQTPSINVSAQVGDSWKSWTLK